MEKLVANERRTNTAELGALFGNEPELRAGQERAPRARRLIANDQRIEPAGTPLRRGVVRREKMIAPQVKQHPLLPSADHGVAPAIVPRLADGPGARTGPAHHCRA